MWYHLTFLLTIIPAVLVGALLLPHRNKDLNEVYTARDKLPDLSGGRAAELIALDDALNALANIDSRKARVVELRFFGGLSVEEAAEVLAVSPDTVMRDWKFARSWLHAQLSEN